MNNLNERYLAGVCARFNRKHDLFVFEDLSPKTNTTSLQSVVGAA